MGILTFPRPVNRVCRPLQPSITEHCTTVQESNRKRSKNNRDNLTQAMRAGRALTDIKSCLQHGQWGAWLESNIDKLGYGAISTSPIRAAQYDMLLWRKMCDYQDRLVASGLMHDIEASEQDIVDHIEDQGVTVAVSAFYELTRKGVPETAIDLMLSRLADGDNQDGTSFDTPAAKRLAEYAKRRDSLSDEHQLIADRLYVLGLDNPDVVDCIPTLASEHSDILAEMLATGHISVPHREESLPVSSIGRTDIDMAIGEEETEEAFTYIERNKPLVAEIKGARQRGFVQQRVIEGTPAQVQHLLSEAVKGVGGKTVRVVLYVQEGQPEK